MLTHAVTVIGASLETTVSTLGTFVAAEEAPTSDLNPIAPELKEIIWGFGSFVVFAVLLRFVLYPKLQRGTEAREQSIRDDFEAAETLTASARAEVAEYEAQLATVRSEANARVETARETLEAERQAKLDEVNARIAERREAAAAEVAAAREAAQGQIADAVADVAARAGELATGNRPDDGTVRAAVDRAMGVGVTS